MKYSLPTLVTLLTAASLPAAEISASAQKAMTDWLGKQFLTLDTDHDGALSLEEAKPLAPLLHPADGDKDGQITGPEVAAYFKGPQGQAIREAVHDPIKLAGLLIQLDANKDGKVTKDEAGEKGWLMVLDSNKDGSLNLLEAGAALLAMATPINLTVPPALEKAPPNYEPKNSSSIEPVALSPAREGIGRRIGGIELTAIDGRTINLDKQHGAKGTVIALISTSCPASQRCLPELARLEKEWLGKGVAFLYLAANAADADTDLKKTGLGGPIVRDPSGKLLRLLRARTTCDCFLIDSAQSLVYRGAIDDRHGLDQAGEEVKDRFLVDAMTAVSSGSEPAIAATNAPGSPLKLPATSELVSTKEKAAPTWHGDVSRLLQRNCMECHRKGGVGPFSLESAELASAKSGMIRRMVSDGLMPPWQAAPSDPSQHSPWANDRSLPEEDKAAILAWIEGGKPVGDPKLAPLPRQWPGEWSIGQPDQIWQIPQPIAVKAEGTMPYQNVRVPSGLLEDKWVTAYEVQPTARAVVHHVIVYLEKQQSPGVKPRNDSGNHFAAFVPGSNFRSFPEGFARLLPKGSVLRFEIHYTPNGAPTEDQVRIGVRYAKEKPAHPLELAAIANVQLKIPAGAANHPEVAIIPVPQPVRLTAFMPHMHLRGKAFRFEVELPGGNRQTLCDVPDYDFNWQIGNRPTRPISIPAGSRIIATGWFDNSTGNPANPDPNKTVKWGPQTYDEMMLGYVEYYKE